MSIKKRLTALALTGLLAVSSAVPALAADPTIDVRGTYSGEATAQKVISIGYEAAETMHFLYSTGGDKGTWDPATHSYSGGSAASGGKWTPQGDTSVKVVNHSNSAVNIAFSWAAKAGFEGVKVGTSKNNFKLATAEGTAVAEAPSETVTVGMTADSAGISEGQTDVSMGTLTLKVTAA